MNACIKEISESEFKRLKIPVLFEDELTDRTFGVLSDGKNIFKLGWQSEIKPVIKWIDLALCSIGIDLIFIIFEFGTGRVLKKLSLDYYFYDTKIFKEAMYVITELEIIKINITDLAIVGTYSLPDYYERIEFNEDLITIKCIDDEIVNLD
ncbi:MAG TPA: hypothetical protein PK246_09115 [Saprospiraceae bacterium]|nr:hypothetical protein [Lewinellaceae bacterium]HPK10479.1 hypothetical protein [Saprospiraceae bacterium]